MAWEPCLACKAPVMIEPDGTVIGLSALQHKCWGHLPELIACHCGALVWLAADGSKTDMEECPHNHEQPPAAPAVEQQGADLKEQQEAWGLKIGADRLP